MKIEQLMQDIVDQPAPPSALRADAVYNAGRRRIRRTHRTYGGLLVATVLAAAGVVGANAQTFDVGPFAPASHESDGSPASVDSSASADADASADAGAGAGASAGADADAGADVDVDAGADASADVDAGADVDADAGADAWADVDAGADVDASADAAAPALPNLPPLDCDTIAATVLAELAAPGLSTEGDAEVKCEDGTLVVVVTTSAEPVQTDLTVEVTLAEAATIDDIVCADGVSCEETAAGVLASAAGEVALGRSDGLVVRIYADLEQSVRLQGEIDEVPSAAQLRDLALSLGESLPTP